MKNFLAILLLVWYGAAWAEPAYVMDSVNAKLRSGKGENYRTLRIIPSKTEVEILEPDEEFAKVKTADGQIGWIKSSLLKPKPSDGKDGTENPVQATPMPEINKEPATPVDAVTAKASNETNVAAPRFQGQGDMSFSNLLIVALVAFLAGVGVGVALLRAYYLRRLHGLRI